MINEPPEGSVPPEIPTIPFRVSIQQHHHLAPFAQLIAQQLDQSIRQLKESICTTDSRRADEAKMAAERAIEMQLKIIRDRTNEMITRANETRADNLIQVSFLYPLHRPRWWCE